MKSIAKGTVAALAAMLLSATTAGAAAGPVSKCEAGKNQESGKYAFCLHKAEAKLLKAEGACSVTTATDCYRDAECPPMETCVKDPTGYNEAVVKCETKYSTKWTTLEAKALEDSATCPDEPLLQADVKAVIDDCVANVASGLAGDGLTDCTGDLATCNSNLGTCNGNLGSCNSSLSSCTSSLSTCNTNYSSCSGSLATCNAGTATAADVLAGKTFSSMAGLGVTGTAAAGANVNGANGLQTFTIPDGLYSGSKTATANDSNLVAGNIVTGANIFGVTGTALPGQRVKTGQTLCYNAAGAVIACAGSGQDGELQKGLTVSYTDNGNGTVTDNRTGLMWEKLSDDGSIHDKDTTYNWTNAFATKIATLNSGSFAGYTDWRLPNVNELQSLAKYGAVNPSIDAAFNTACAPACTVTTCSCTVSNFYWSSTTYQFNPSSPGSCTSSTAT